MPATAPLLKPLEEEDVGSGVLVGGASFRTCTLYAQMLLALTSDVPQVEVVSPTPVRCTMVTVGVKLDAQPYRPYQIASAQVKMPFLHAD